MLNEVLNRRKVYPQDLNTKVSFGRAGSGGKDALHEMSFALAASPVSLGNLSTYREKKVTEVQLLTKQCGGDSIFSSCSRPTVACCVTTLR